MYLCAYFACMQFFDTLLTCYGWEGIALAGAVLAMFGVQLY